MALKMRISQKQYNLIERGVVQLKFKDLITISLILEINICDLIEEAGLDCGMKCSKKDILIRQQNATIEELRLILRRLEAVNDKLLHFEKIKT